MVGVRVLGKAFDSFDFTLNYLFKRAEGSTFIDWGASFDPAFPGTGKLRDDFPVFFASDPIQSRAWFDRCLRDNKTGFLFGGDIYGYNSDDNPLNDRVGTTCVSSGTFYPWTHVVGFTVTYNDFEYTGGVFRLEQSFSTNEGRSFSVRSDRPAVQDGIPRDEFGNPCPGGFEAGNSACPNTRAFGEKSKSGTGVWRSMVGLDLIRTFRFLPGTFGRNPWFMSIQQFLTYQNDNRPTSFPLIPFSRNYRWEQLYSFVGTGTFFRGRLEPIWAFSYSVNAKQPLVLLQTIWHGLYLPSLDIQAGMALYLGSRFDVDGSFLFTYADRDTFWVRLQYYLL